VTGIGPVVPIRCGGDVLTPFQTVRIAVLGELFRGVSFTPGSPQRWCLDGQAGRLSLSA